MDTYIIGHFLGRVLVSYAALWLIIFVIFTRLSWRDAFRKLHRWYGLLSVIVLTLLGMAAGTVT